MKVTIKYIDDSISVIDIPDNGNEYIINAGDDYFTIDDENDNSVAWIVKDNVKYVVMGELIENFISKSKEEVKNG